MDGKWTGDKKKCWKTDWLGSVNKPLERPVRIHTNKQGSGWLLSLHDKAVMLMGGGLVIRMTKHRLIHL